MFAAMRVLKVFGLALGLWPVGACGPGLASQNAASPAPVVRPGVSPPSDEGALRKLLVDEVVNGGLWFADAPCEAHFGPSGTVKPDAFDELAHCLAGLHLRPTGRGDSFDDTSVLTDDAGFEIEVRITAGRLDFIGFSGRAPGTPDLPSITREALESLRAAGDPNATISADEAGKLLPPHDSNRTLTEHLRVCLADNGDVSAVVPATATTIASATAFSAVAVGWKFRPFVAGGKPMAVCAIVGFRYPAAARDAEQARLPRPPELSKAGHLVYIVSPGELEKLRVAGTKLVEPDDHDKKHLNGKRLVGTFKLCIDETGHYERGVLLRSTGYPGYDAKIARTMMEWAYQPYVVDGGAIPICTAVTFIYTQH
jgi:hypothetical protein